MDYLEFAGDLPLHRTIRFASVEENEQTMRRLGVDQAVRQLGTGTFRCDIATRSTKHVDLLSDRFNKSIMSSFAPPAGMVGFVFFRSVGGASRACGDAGANDKLLFVPTGASADVIIPGLAGSDCICVDEPRFIAMTDALCPTLPSTLPENRATLIAGDTAKRSALQQAIVKLVAEPNSEAEEEHVSNLVAETIAWMSDAVSHQRVEGFASNGAHAQVAKQAQAFIYEHYRGTVRMDDLCRMTNVGVRTLQRAFREYFDVTISEYLKTLRLDNARRELAAARPAKVTVASVAFNHGFTHFGRFSVEFRQRFGRSASQTLAM